MDDCGKMNYFDSKRKLSIYAPLWPTAEKETNSNGEILETQELVNHYMTVTGQNWNTQRRQDMANQK